MSRYLVSEQEIKSFVKRQRVQRQLQRFFQTLQNTGSLAIKVFVQTRIGSIQNADHCSRYKI